MPQLGETVTEGTITRWMKQVGDAVAEDEVLFEVSTDKVDAEVPSPASGLLSEIFVPEGVTAAVGTKLAVVSAAQLSPEIQAGAEVAPGSARPTGEIVAHGADHPAAPAPQVQPSRNRMRSPGDADKLPANDDGPDKVLSPVVRRLIDQYHLDVSQIEGTGAGGRITRMDVATIVARQNSPRSAPAGVPAISEPTSVSRADPGVRAGERDTIVIFNTIRRRTAEHMVMSQRTSAHTVVAVEVDYSAVEKARSVRDAHFKETEGFGLTFLPFITRAVVDAIGKWPYLNSSVGVDDLIVHNYVNIGIAVDLDFEGLLVPVIHEADAKRLPAIAREISDLGHRARSKKLTVDELTGGTFTVTNVGAFGTVLSIPVINQPQIAILATDGVRKRPVVVELADGDDSIAIHPMGNLVLSFDHRAIDGAYAAAFMRTLKDILETRDWLAEL